ncbi:UNVERIFIED_CONTAM: hypothetical protein Sangu_1154200 [Sesamum angustifolium]|uniref:Leucine-rich repeat domain, L domain-containing protein n=1 Tax=Sesamum angustifolium TaxID=2727405 RepID=A0AAW2NZV2_9LAMI
MISTCSVLEILKMSTCPNLKSIPYSSGKQTQGFTSLRSLNVSWCKALTNLPCEMVASCAASLEYMMLVGLISLTNFSEVFGHIPTMPRVTYLGIGDVPRFTYLPTDIGSLGNLYYLHVFPFSDSRDLAYSEEFLDVLFRGLKSLRVLWLYGHKHWDCLPYQIQHFTSLTELAICSFGIKSIP